MGFLLSCADDLTGFLGEADGNRMPNAPECVTSIDVATGVSVSVNLEWSCSDPDGDALTYEVFISPKGGDWQQVDAQYISGTTCDLPAPLDYETVYFWFVRAYDSCGKMSEPTENWSFQTEPETGTAPDTPSLVAPADGATDVALRPNFQWSVVLFKLDPTVQIALPRPVALDNSAPTGLASDYDSVSVGYSLPGAEAVVSTSPKAVSLDLSSRSGSPVPPSPAEDYRIQVDDDSDFSSPVIDETGVTDSEFHPTDDLDTDITYYWRAISGATATGPMPSLVITALRRRTNRTILPTSPTPPTTLPMSVSMTTLPGPAPIPTAIP